MASVRRGGGVWLWALVSLAAGGGAIALDIFAIVQTSALLGTQGYPGNFPSSPLGVRTIAVMALAIAGLVGCALMALTGLLALFGVRWAALAYAFVTFLGFIGVAAEVMLGIPREYDDPVSQYGVNYNGQPLEGLPMWGGVIVMFLFLGSLVLTRSAYRYAVERSNS